MTMDTWTGIVLLLMAVLAVALLAVVLGQKKGGALTVVGGLIGIGLLGLVLLDPVSFVTDVWTWGEGMLADDSTPYRG